MLCVYVYFNKANIANKKKILKYDYLLQYKFVVLQSVHNHRGTIISDHRNRVYVIAVSVIG